MTWKRGETEIAWVAGQDVVADPVGVKRRIGVVTQNNTLDMQLTVAENLEFRSRFFGTRRSAGVPLASEVAALIADAPEPRPTLIKTFNAMMAREFRVLRRNAIATFTRAVMQPLLFVFVFAYVFPKIGGGFNLAGGAAASGGATSRAPSTSPPSSCRA